MNPDIMSLEQCCEFLAEHLEGLRRPCVNAACKSGSVDTGLDVACGGRGYLPAEPHLEVLLEALVDARYTATIYGPSSLLDDEFGITIITLLGEIQGRALMAGVCSDKDPLLAAYRAAVKAVQGGTGD